jgi:hypothetical protein
MTLISLPHDIYPNIFSNLTRSQICAFGRVATFAQDILLQLARCQQENVNRNGGKGHNRTRNNRAPFPAAI